MEVAKAHAARDDVVVLLDMPARVDLSPVAVRALCDRRGGMGADGVLRITVAGSAREAGVFDVLPDGVSEDDWFADYRDSTGTPVPVCGNAIRVLAHYVWATGLERRTAFEIGCLAGPRPATVHSAGALDGDVSIDMGTPSVLGDGEISLGDRRFGGLVVDVGERHLACIDPSLTVADLADLNMASVDDADVEVLTAPFGDVVSARLIKRRVGETPSSGTGAVAAAVAALRHADRDTGALTVRSAGGDLRVMITERAYLRGPSVIVSRGELSDGWWATHRGTVPSGDVGQA